MNKTLSLILIVFFTTISSTLLSQEYKRIFEDKYDISKDSAKAYSNRLCNSNNVTEKAFGFASKAYILSREGDYNGSQKYINKSFITLEEISNSTTKAELKLQVLYYYSNLLLTEHKIEKANEKINEGLKLSHELDDVIMQIKFNNLIGRSFSLLGLDKKAIENGNNTIKQLKLSKDKFKGSSYNNTLFNAYLNTGNRTINFFLSDSINNRTYLDSTKIFIEKAKEFIETNNVLLNSKQKRRILTLKADASFFSKKYSEAISNYKKALEIAQVSNLKKRAYQIKFRIAECYFFLENYEKAKKMFNELEKKDLNRFKLLKNGIIINSYYAQIYQKSGKVELALKYSDSFNSALENYYKEKSNLKVDIYTKNELRAKKNQINELRDGLSNQKEKTNQLSLYLLASITIIIFGFISVLIFLKKQKQKYKAKFDNLTVYIENLKSNKEKPLAKKIKEHKAKTILSKLKAIESQNLFTDKEYSLNKIAKKIGSNSAYVSQVVNEYWDKSFVQYTNELRINYILLKFNKDKIYQKFTLLAIAESAGYKSLSSFNKHFKSITGLTPKQYSKHLKEHS